MSTLERATRGREYLLDTDSAPNLTNAPYFVIMICVVLLSLPTRSSTR